MKKTLWLVIGAIMLFAACEEEKEKTTVQIVNDVEEYSSADPYLNGSIYEVRIHKFIDGDDAGHEEVGTVESGGDKSDKIEVDSKVEKVKISFKLLPAQSSNYYIEENARLYTASYKYIDEGSNNTIVVENSTEVKSTLTKIQSTVIKELNVIPSGLK